MGVAVFPEPGRVETRPHLTQPLQAQEVLGLVQRGHLRQWECSGRQAFWDHLGIGGPKSQPARHFPWGDPGHPQARSGIGPVTHRVSTQGRGRP